MGSQEEIGVGTLVADTYEVTGLLGQGGMGQVWEARHRRLPGKRVAVKVLLVQAAADSTSYARFRREAEIASRLGHPNIVEAIDFNTLPSGTPYIILEFLKGESLAKRIASGPVSLRDTMAIVRQVASALAAAHKEGVVHRDLKPDNIYLCPTDTGGVVSEHVKVLDFGISKIKDSKTVQTQASALIGTPQYMSPEQASGKHDETDHRTDQFALGAIVFEMLIGEAVFAGQTLAAVITKVLFEEVPLERLAGKAPDHAIAAVARALKKNAAERFPDIGAFIAALTGRPLQTLESVGAFAAVEVPPDVAPFDGIDPLGGTVAPRTPTGNQTGEVRSTAVAPPMAEGPATEVMAPGKGRVPLLLGSVGVLLGIGAILFVALQEKSKPPEKPARTAAPSPAAVTPASPGPASPGPASPGPASPGPAAAVPAPSPASPSPKPTAAPKALPPAAEDLIKDAERYLVANEGRDALRSAQKSLEIADSLRARSLIARSACLLRDGEKPRIQRTRIRKQSMVEWKKIQEFCKQYEIELP